MTQVQPEVLAEEADLLGLGSVTCRWQEAPDVLFFEDAAGGVPEDS